MKTFTTVVFVILGTVSALACANGSDVRNSGATSTRPKPGEAADGAAGGQAAAAANAARETSSSQPVDVCALLSATEVAEILGIAVERVERTPSGCEWYSNAAAQQQRGVDTVRGTFDKLTREEPKSAGEGARRMEDMLKGMTSAAAPGKPLFALSIQWHDADQAEAMAKTTVGVVGGGLQGGRLEPIEGLGDRAYVAAAGVLFYVRKGPALLTFGSLGTREQTIALARRAVSRI